VVLGYNIYRISTAAHLLSSLLQNLMIYHRLFLSLLRNYVALRTKRPSRFRLA